MGVVKWQRALVTPFRVNATAPEAVQLQLVSTLFTGKKYNMTCVRNMHIKDETYFSSTTGRINLL